jgi:hypothetical protein
MMERKEFIRTSGRWVIFGVLAVITGGLILKKKVSVSGNACDISNGPCRNCAVLATCTLPEAVKIKNHEKNKGI